MMVLRYYLYFSISLNFNDGTPLLYFNHYTSYEKIVCSLIILEYFSNYSLHVGFKDDTSDDDSGVK